MDIDVPPSKDVTFSAKHDQGQEQRRELACRGRRQFAMVSSSMPRNLGAANG